MGKVLVTDTHLTDIANAIRDKKGSSDTYKPSEMASAIKNISGGEPILEDLEVSPTTSEQVITAHQGYDGINQITIAPVTNLIDDDIRPENIKKGVEILGVTGNIEDKPAEPVLQNKTVEPNVGKQIITADSGYDGLGQVTVNEVTSKIDSNIKADNIKQGVSILGVQGTLEQGAEVVKKYKPQWITFVECPIVDLTEETRMLDTSLITTMYKMFYTSSVEFLDISGWDTSNVTDMALMFRGSKIKNISISNFDTSKVTTMNQMFRTCTNLTSGSLSNFENSVLSYVIVMFHTCSLLTSINLKNFNTVNLTSLEYMVFKCIKLEEVDFSSFITTNVTSIAYLFSECTSLKKIDIRNFTFERLNRTYDAFKNIPTNCLIIVKSDVEKSTILSIRSDLTNVKTLAEYQAEGGV